MSANPLDSYERDDPTFVQDLIASEVAVWRVAKWIHASGKDVTVHRRYIRDSVRDISGYHDRGDLLSNGERIEVKHRPKLHFTGADDYPYPTIFVDVEHTWGRAARKPKAYVILNSGMTHAAVVMAESSPMWERVEKFDASKGRRRTFLECPVSCALFRRLPA